MGPMTSLTRALGGLATVGALGLGYAGLVERNAFALRRVSVPVLPAGSRPLRVLHLSDLHLVPGQRRKIEWVRGLAALEPDLVVDTGDNIAHRAAVPDLLEAMEPLMGFPGVFVLGSNDYFAPTFKNPALYLTPQNRRGVGRTPRLPTDDLVKGLVAGGWEDLTNSRAYLSVGGADVEFVGVDDAHLDYDRYAAVAGPADPSVALTVGVTHAPYLRVLDAMTADGAGLVIAGHTHGGQLALPFYGALVTNCDLDRGRAKGLSRWWPGAGKTPSSHAPEDAAWLHVSAGLGTSPFAPFRFACRPEATLLTLTPR
jgi:predicted MPP superfamily phosphohydrolase